MFQVRHILASVVLMEDEFSKAHLRTRQWKIVCIKPDLFPITIQYTLLAKNHLLIYQRLAVVIYHILGTHGLKPRNESETRMAGGKNTLPILLLFHVAYAKINQQLWKVFGTDCRSSNHPGFMSLHPKVLRKKQSYIPSTKWRPIGFILWIVTWNVFLLSSMKRIKGIY